MTANNNLVEATFDMPAGEVRRLAEDNLYFFCRAILGYDHMQIEPHLVLCQKLEALAAAHGSLRVTMPRGALKTTIASKGFPIWVTAKNPNLSVLIVANTFDNACKMVHEIRQQWESNQMLRGLFPECVPEFHKVKWTDECALLKRSSTQGEGTYEAAGVGTSLPSRHYHVIVMDDLVRAQIDNATGEEFEPDPSDIEKGILFIKMVDGLWVVSKDRIEAHIGTRWAVHDVIDWLKREERCETAFEIAALNEAGEPTYPWKYDKAELKRLRKSLGSYMFDTQYMNMPRALSEQIFPMDKVIYYDTLPNSPLAISATVDPASSKKKQADYTVIILNGVDKKTGNWFVLDALRAKMSPTETIEKIIHFHSKWSPSIWGIEVVGYQEALRDFLKRTAKERGIYIPVKPLKTPTTVSKDQRIRGLQPRFMRNGISPVDTTNGIFLAPHLKQLHDEVVDFPQNYHDDLLDALAYHNQLSPQVLVRQEPANPHFLSIDRIMSEYEKGLRHYGSLAL